MIISRRPLYLVAGLAVMLLLGGCETVATTMLVPVQPTPKKIRKRAHPGDKVVITTQADKQYKLEVTQVTKDSVIGMSVSEEGKEEKELTVSFEQIKAIKVERITRTYKDQSAGARFLRGLGQVALMFLFLGALLALAI